MLKRAASKESNEVRGLKKAKLDRPTSLLDIFYFKKAPDCLRAISKETVYLDQLASVDEDGSTTFKCSCTLGDLHFEAVNGDLDKARTDAAGKLMHALVCKRDLRLNQLPTFFDEKLLTKDRDEYIRGLVEEVYGVLSTTIFNTRQARSVGGACGRPKTATIMINGKQCSGEAKKIGPAKLLALREAFDNLVGEIANPVADVPSLPPIRMKITRETAIKILRKLKPKIKFTSKLLNNKEQEGGPIPPPPLWKAVFHIEKIKYEGKASTEDEAAVEAALAALKGLNIENDIDEPKRQSVAQPSGQTLPSEQTMTTRTSNAEEQRMLFELHHKRHGYYDLSIQPPQKYMIRLPDTSVPPPPFHSRIAQTELEAPTIEMMPLVGNVGAQHRAPPGETTVSQAQALQSDTPPAGLARIICNDFLNGLCKKGKACTLLHPPQVCFAFTHGKCHKGSKCTFLHMSGSA